MDELRKPSPQASEKNGGLSRRAFLASATSAAAYVALSGGTGLSLSPAEAKGSAEALGIEGETRGLVAGADRLVAVGSDGEGQPAIWTSRSVDGEWEATSLDNAFADAELHGIHRARGTYLVLGAVTIHESVSFEPAETDVGGDETYEFTQSRRVPAIWRSEDASGWERQLLDAEVDGNAILTAAASDGRRTVAVGSRLDADSAEGVGALVVHSDDGRQWQEAAIEANHDVLAEGGLTAVVAHGGTWAAVGGHIQGGVVLSSSDGTSWSIWDAPDAELSDLPLQGLVAEQGALLAAGAAIDDATPVLFASDDGGQSWGRDNARLRSLNKPDAIVHNLTISADDSSLLAIGTKAGKPTIERGQSGGFSN